MQTVGDALFSFKSMSNAETIEDLLNRCGEVPLPPYIERHDPGVLSVIKRASRIVRVAAPTAGLHFSDELLAALERKGVALERITLHVGLGTFRPVETEDLTLSLHSEWVEVQPAVVEAVQACTGRSSLLVQQVCVRSRVQHKPAVAN